MSQFLYLYRRGELPDRSPQQNQEIVAKWFAWMKELTASGNLKDPGQPLEDGGKVVRGRSKTVTDGPFFESKDLIGGYSVIEADDLDHAARLAEGCPVFEFDAAVEIRPILKMDI